MKFYNKKVSSPQGKKLFFPIISILAVVVTLLVILGISTYRHLNRAQMRMEESLFRDGQIILKSLEISFRTGMMGMMGRLDNLQDIMSSITTLSDIRYVALLDQNGLILAHSEERLVGTSFPQKEKFRAMTTGNGPKSWFGEKGEFVVLKRLEPFPYPGMNGPGMSGMMSMRRSMVSGGTDLLDEIQTGRVFALVALDTRTFVDARQNDLRHTLLMGLILLVLGTAGFYFIFLVQNYYVAQKALESITTYTAHVVEHMPDGLISLDPSGAIVTLNSRARDILGLTGKVDDRQEIKKRVQPFLQPFMVAISKKEPLQDQETPFPVRPGETIPVSLSAAPVVSDTGEDLGSVLIIRDLREIKALQEKIKTSERLAGLGSLAAGMAHEIRNPLSSIKGFAQYFFKKNPPESEGRQYSQVIIQEVDRLNRVISNLLDFARPKEPVLELVSLPEIIQHSVGLIRENARSGGIEVRTDIGGGLPPLLADRDQLTQVLLNIGLNGLEALEGGGTLVVRCSADREARTLVMEIEDSGPGMSAEELSRIFDPFYTTKRKGTGLGLAIAYRIIEKHRGTLSVRSQPGSGTLFRIELPLPTEEGLE